MSSTSKIAKQFVSKAKNICFKSSFSEKINTKMVQINNRVKPKFVILKNYCEDPIVKGSTYLGGFMGTCYEVRRVHDSGYSSTKFITSATKGLLIGIAIGFSLPALAKKKLVY